MIENGEFDYMHPNAKCYRRQMLSTIEKFVDVPFNFNGRTHISFVKVKDSNFYRSPTERFFPILAKQKLCFLAGEIVENV